MAETILDIPLDSFSQVPTPRPVDTPPTAELVECTCPEWCERDHERD